MNYDAIIFDLDGTLANTIEDLADAANWTLEQFGLPVHPVDAYKKKVGNGVMELARAALPAGRDDLIPQILPVMRKQYHEHMFDKTRLYDGVPALLDELSRRPVKTAVLSNKPQAATTPIVARLLDRWRFDIVRGAMPNVPLKPDPAGAIAIAAELNIPCARFLYVGDTNTDIRTAVGAGMHPVGVLWGFRDAAELLAAGARTLIEQPGELLKLL